MGYDDRQPFMDVLGRERLLERLRWYARFFYGHRFEDLSGNDLLTIVGMAVREHLMDQMIRSEERCRRLKARRLYYLSIEYLMGRSLETNLINLGLLHLYRDTLSSVGIDFDDVVALEPDAGLGNGGLGRLAACFLDSLATLDLPGYAYGINYEYGLFRQVIDNGSQREAPDAWRQFGSPWLVEHPEERVDIPIYGRIDHSSDKYGEYNPMWLDWEHIYGIPSDMPIVGYGGRTVNRLRLFAAGATQDMDIAAFNSGDYLKAVQQKVQSETISKVLYPSDSVESGKELRLLQEYFFVACALRDIMNRFESGCPEPLSCFRDRVSIQLNDTHPSLAIAELMRLLVDERNMDWDQAWDTTQEVFGYTNHTLMPEALEVWPTHLIERVIPRHMQLIEEIDRRFVEWLSKDALNNQPAPPEFVDKVRIITTGDVRQVRMAHLAIIGSHSVNGVAAIHSELVKTRLVPEFAQLFPERFNNKTNGITPRRWIVKANPGLTELLCDSIGDDWITNLDRLTEAEEFFQDTEWMNQLAAIKRANKVRVIEACHLEADPDSLFDIQVKRIHEYKRQLLNLLHVIARYLEIEEDGIEPAAPRTVVIGGKAAPGYWVAKQIIRFANSVAKVVASSERASRWLTVHFVPDYRVTLAELLIPAADLSEQISTAGTEASGTGNMKFALNGAITIGTLDGANIEIRDHVGHENMFIFGLTAEEVEASRQPGAWNAREEASRQPMLMRVLDAIANDRFSPEEPGRYKWIVNRLLDENDYYRHIADFPSYIKAQRMAESLYTQQDQWRLTAARNITRVGYFSSDRTVSEYARDIWRISSTAPD